MQVRVFHGSLVQVDSFYLTDVIPHAVAGVDSDATILEWVFRAHNAVDGNERNVRLGLRSLSVGDVVGLDERRYLCAPLGWRLINGE